MKRILCFIDGLSSGGAQRQLVGLASLLNDKNYDVLMMWYHKSDFYKPYLVEHKIPYKQIEGSSRLLKLFKIIKSIVSFKPDTIIAYIDGPTTIVSALKFLGLRAKVIVSERNTTQQLSLREKLKFTFYRWADVIVPNSYSQEKFISSNFPKLSSKVQVITNFVDTNYFVPAEQITISDKIRLIVVGRINKQKNVLNFIEAISEVCRENETLIIDWYGNPNADLLYFEECKRLINEKGLESRFSFHSPTSNILDVYKNADVFCLPSIYEGYPNVICEAMSCGLPILCSNVCDNPIIVKDGINGYLFNPNEISDMAEKIKIFIQTSPSDRQKMGDNSRNLAIESFSSEQFVKKYLKII